MDVIREGDRCIQPGCNGIYKTLSCKEGNDLLCCVCAYPPVMGYREMREEKRRGANRYNWYYRAPAKNHVVKIFENLTSDDWKHGNKDLAERFDRSESWVSRNRPPESRIYGKRAG